MKTVCQFKLFAALCFFSFCSAPAFSEIPAPGLSEILLLKTSNVCSIKVRGTQITDAVIIAHREQLLNFLGQLEEVYVHDCTFLPSDNMPEESEVEWVLKNRAISAPPEYANLATNRIIFSRVNPVEFFKVYTSSVTSKPGTTPPVKEESEPTPSPGAQDTEMCGEPGDIRISKEGEATFAFPCGLETVSFSTSGHIEIGVSGELGGASITLPELKTP